MRHFSLLLFSISLLFPVLLCAQEQSTRARYQRALQERINNGTYEGFKCADDYLKPAINLLAKDDSCPETFAGYGTPGWNPNSSPETNNVDPSCTVPFNTRPCNGGKLRIPVRNIIFECPSWNGTNYVDGNGFERLPDADIDATYASMNEYFANANVEFVEVERRRQTNCDMYDFYWNGFDPQEQNDPFNDGVKDETQLPGYDTQDVIDVYWVGGFNGRHDCCSFFLARLDKPPSTRDYAIFRYVGAVNPSLAHHEMSHYFGVYHTFWNIQTSSNHVTGQSHTSLNNSDCLTTSDGICDTWPDPHFEYRCARECRGGGSIHCYRSPDGCEFDYEAYRCVNGHDLQIDPAAGTVIDQYTSTVMQSNITTYNNHQCRNSFTPCQYFKLNTVAKSCRSNLCFSDPSVYFNAPSDYQKTINPEDAIPTFTAGKMHTSFDGSSYAVDCFDWFLNENDLWSEAVVTGSSTFDPSAYVDGPGVYTFYLAEANALSNPPCKIPVRLTIRSQSCDNCATCDDGIQNGDETGVDCGGADCPPCTVTPTCEDGILNGDETGIDCGGSCDPCPTIACDAPATLSISENNGSSVMLHWSPVPEANSYTVQVERMNDGRWSQQTTTDTFLMAAPLDMDVMYEWRVQSNCTNESSAFSTPMIFVAGQQPTCVDTLITQNLADDMYLFNEHASITSDVEIESNTTVTFLAADYILLEAGFHAKAGSEFTARIQACSPAMAAPIIETRNITATHFDLYPNPANQLLQLMIDPSEAATMEVDLFSLDGRMIRLLSTNIEPARQQFEFATDHLPNGLYILRLRVGQEIWNQKVMIQH
jgi:hypothetical protein